MTSRRTCLLAPLALWGASVPGWAQQRKSLADPMRLGVDTALLASGLARALQQGFGRDTGVAVRLVGMPALPLLESLERGEVDAALANVPEVEARLAQQGLAHDRHAIATGEFVLVGPAPRGKTRDPAAVAGQRSVIEALTQVRSAALLEYPFYFACTLGFKIPPAASLILCT